MHLTHRDEESELVVVNIELEEGPTTDDLQSREDDLGHVHVTDEDVTRDLPYVLEEAEVEGFVLEPCDLQIAIDVSTVGVPVSKIPVVMLFVGRHGQTAIGTDANCKHNNLQIIFIFISKLIIFIFISKLNYIYKLYITRI